MKTRHAYDLAVILNTMLKTKGMAGFKIARNLRMIDEELKEYYSKRDELFSKYGTESNGQYIIAKDSENYPLFMEEIRPYDEQEVEFDFRKITESEIAESELTAEQMLLIWEMME